MLSKSEVAAMKALLDGFGLLYAPGPTCMPHMITDTTALQIELLCKP